MAVISGCAKKYTASAHAAKTTYEEMFTHLRTTHQIAAGGFGGHSNSGEFIRGALGR
jgi:hypothetical protein